VAKKREKTKKPIDITKWIPLMVIVGFIIGVMICWYTFSHLGGN